MKSKITTMKMFGIKSLAGYLRRNTTLTMALLAFFVGLISVKISTLEIFGLKINELTVTLTFAITIYVLMSGLRYWENATDRNVNNMDSRKEFFQLVKLSVDISSEVLRKLVNSKILSNAKYGGCLHKFLYYEKHYLYHQWQGSTPCCSCPSGGCTLRKSKHLKEWLFKILYSGNPQVGAHVKFNGHRISNYCLDCFKPNLGLTMNQFDVTILSFFIEHFVPLSPREFSSLNDVVAVRNLICHASNTSSFESKELESLWIKLREASLTLTDSLSRNLLKDQISMIKKVEFDKTDIELLKEKVEREGEMLEEICKFMNQNGVTKDFIKETEGRIVTHINTKIEGMEDDVKTIKDGQSKIVDQVKQIVTEQINAMHLEVHLYPAKKCIIGDGTGELTERLIVAVGRIDDENIDERSVVENITNNNDTDDNQDKFNVVSAKQSCIILNLECSSYVLKSEQSFRSAVRSLLSDIVRAGNIDTSSSSTIVLQLEFCSPLTEDEINIINDIVVREDVKQKNFEMYKISSFKSQVLEITNEYGIIIMTDESHIPAEADVEVRLWGDPLFPKCFPLRLTAKVVKNAIEFFIPWNIFVYDNQPQVSVYNKRMKIETSKQTIKLKSSDNTKKSNELKRENLSKPYMTRRGESDFRSDRYDDNLESVFTEKYV